MYSLLAHMLKPVLNEVPEKEFREGCREEIERSMEEAIRILPYIPSEEPGPGPEKVEDDLKNQPSFKVLHSFALFPLKPVCYKCEDLGMSEEQIRKLISYLQEQKWLGEMESIPSGKPGAPTVSALVLPAGLKALGMPPERYKYNRGKGGLAHRVLQRRIQDGVGGIIEHRGCDVYASDGQKTVAYEIETEVHDSHEHWISNINRDLEFADHVVVVCLNQNACKALKKKISSRLTKEILEKVSFATIKEVLKNAA